jgi:hypothetical protein
VSETFLPRPFQTDAISWLLDRPNAALFASMGTGKTVITLTALEQLLIDGQAKGALLIAPIRVGTLTWPNQITHWKHTRWMRYANLRTPEGLKAWEEGSAEIYFINREMLIDRGKSKGFVSRCIRGRKELPVDVFILDETSTMKGHAGKASKAIRPFLHDIEGRYKTPFKRRWGLTGTPAAESYLGLFNQVLMLDGGKRLGRSFWQFRQTHFGSDYMGWKWEIRPGAKDAIDAKLADLALVIRGEDHLDLPPCEVEDVDVTLPPDARKAYKTLEKELLVQLKTGEIEALSAATLVTKLAQVTSGVAYDSDGKEHVVHDAKIKALRKIQAEHKGEPLLVMCHFKSTRKRLLKAFPEAEPFDEMDMARWQVGRIPMWVGNCQSMAHGIDGIQHGGRLIVWVDLTYSAELYAQANARVLRWGQERPTKIIRIMVTDSIDWAIAEALRAKDEQQKGLLSAVKALQQLRASA